MNCVDIEDVVEQFDKNLTSHSLTNRYKNHCRVQLLAWYDVNRRKLPWRGDFSNYKIPNAYGTWVSEIMCQQTRVDTVIPYWERWMAKFPTVSVLAQATPDEVNQMWAGLGYYRRAQMLLKGAIKVVTDHNGVVPSVVEELLEIPGIGQYTAGAIASVAYNQPVPVVDCNVSRVLARLQAIKLEIGTALMTKVLWQLAGELVDSQRPGDWNQAVMELGATVCKPSNPSCEACPLAAGCHARLIINHHNTVLETATATLSATPGSGSDMCLDISSFPRKAAKRKPRKLVFSVCVLVDRNGDDIKYMLVRRPAKGLLANQWEFPNVCVWEEGAAAEDEEHNDEDENSDEQLGQPPAAWDDATLEKPLQQLIRDQAQEQSLQLQVLHRASELRPDLSHVFSHQVHTMHITICRVQPSSSSSSSSSNHRHDDDCDGEITRWMTAQQLLATGVTTGCKKILTKVSKFIATAKDLKELPTTETKNSSTKKRKASQKH